MPENLNSKESVLIPIWGLRKIRTYDCTWPKETRILNVGAYTYTRSKNRDLRLHAAWRAWTLKDWGLHLCEARESGLMSACGSKSLTSEGSGLKPIRDPRIGTYACMWPESLVGGWVLHFCDARESEFWRVRAYTCMRPKKDWDLRLHATQGNQNPIGQGLHLYKARESGLMPACSPRMLLSNNFSGCRKISPM